MKKIIIVIVMLFAISAIYAETLDEKIKKFGEENGKMYLQPLVTSFGANLNTGFYNTAKVIKPFRFAVFFNTMVAFVPGSDKTFMAKRPDLTYSIGDDTLYVYEPVEIETATVFGDQGGTFTINSLIPPEDISAGMEIKMPNGANFTTIPFVVPQFHLGLPAGNELMFRFFPKMEINKKVGDISFWGIGLKHSLNKSLLKLIPVDLAVQAVFQNLSVGELIEITSLAANAQISKKLLMWTFYGGLGYEKTNLQAKYTHEQYIYNEQTSQFEYVPIDIDLKMESENDVRITAGIRYSLLIVKLYADYSLCKYPVANFGFGIAF